ncbi:MAG: EAL domain-containing protein, partial [Gammaproteobacteria bacterium]
MEITLQLLIIEESRSDAESLVNTLRNAGHKSHMVHADTLESLEAALQQITPDLVIWTTNPVLPLDELIATLDHSNIRKPVIVVADDCNEITTIVAMTKGAVGMCSYDKPEHLQLIVSREINRIKLEQKSQYFEQHFIESEKRAHLLMESSRDAIAYISEGMHIYANHPYLSMFGFRSMLEIEGTPILDIISQIDHDEFKKFLRDYSDNMIEAERSEFVTHGLLPDGEQFDALMELMPASIDGEPCTQIIIRNQSSSSEELELKIQNLSKQDMVTGLYNRQYFIEELNLTINAIQKTDSTSAILYLLIDNFRDIRENVGISVIDKIILEIAGIVKAHTLPSDITARFGDHSYAILRRNCDNESVLALSNEIRTAVEEHVADINNQSITTTCSLGMVMINQNTGTTQDILSRADLACEVARSSGGNQAHMHNPVVDEQVGKERDQHTHSLIQDALDNDLFKLMFQPIVSLQGDTRENYEILLRMQDSHGELIMPGQFLPVAEETGQLVDIDFWVIRNAINLLAERRKQDSHTRFFIKLAADTLLDSSLSNFVMQCLQEAKLPGNAIVFEISE